MKLPTEPEKAKCVLWLHELKSPSAVQRKYKTYFKRKEAPCRKSIRKWYSEFMNKGHMKGEKRGRKALEDVEINNVKTHFEESPKCSIRQASRELQMSFSSIQKTLRKKYCFTHIRLNLFMP